MCILCVVQKWSRRIATMLPWLVIPLIGLWALSQLLPPGFRFEVTSPRLACVIVLLVTLFWYEVLMPWLSGWRARRSARIRERRRFEAIEMQKLRKTATRRCRNCLTPYRDQNPGGGRFMCSYCGHISRRPVLDMPGPAMLTNNGFLGDLVGKSGKFWNGKVWSENGLICSQDWTENGSWAPGPSSYWGRNGPSFLGGDDHCLAEKSYSGVVVFMCRISAYFFLSIRWLWRKIFRVGSTREDASSDNENKGHSSKKGENGANLHESKSEKARRKAEEKKQARLERELLEEEERKQREEVARLVEERRRLRDEKLEAEKERSKSTVPDKERDTRRETEKRKQERKKDKDKGSSKSNSDCEELEKKSVKDTERRRELDKRSDFDKRNFHKTVSENVRAHALDGGHGTKITPSSFTRASGGGGNRYFDRMKGSVFSSSKAFSSSNFFGRGIHSTTNPVVKVSKSGGSGDHVQALTHRKEMFSAEQLTGNFTCGEEKNTDTASQRPVAANFQSQPVPKKKSWQQLFTRSSSSSTSTGPVLNENQTVEIQSSKIPGQLSPISHSDNQINFSPPLAFSPITNGSMGSSSVPSVKSDHQFPLVGQSLHDFIPEETELFEDPCYVPDPVSLLGPVSESLDNFSLDLGSGFVSNAGSQGPHILKNISTVTEVSKPSPIESPMSRLRVAEEKHGVSSQLTSTPKSRDSCASVNDESSTTPEPGMWQMWGSTPFGLDGLGLVSGSASWLLPAAQSKPNPEDVRPPGTHRLISQLVKEKQFIPGTGSPRKVHRGNGQNGGTFSPLGSGSNESEIWLPKPVFQPLSADKETHFPPLKLGDGSLQEEVIYDNFCHLPSSHPFELPPGSCWSNADSAVHGPALPEEFVESSGQAGTNGGLFPKPDVQSLW